MSISAPPPLNHPSGYWYEGGVGAVGVLNALRDYRAAEAAMRRRTRSSMGMGETDLLALRYLLEAQKAGRQVTPKELSIRLGISSASTTTLIDRLAKTGHVVRKPHPKDRRALILEATRNSDCEVRATLGEMHKRMKDVADSLSEEEAAVVVGFLSRMREAVDKIDTHQPEQDANEPPAG
ncbi:DNA-binding MarR family transcriptional regulator [Arthrobacter pigmenti]|uniref:DNA-binding MarR family transcriptional regulator n=1 Tax=Arthrobacter pigmenti TaxID=271432 RepID=A0A846RL18_9MICC|nr:MarR family transcriptional regulator [Arthrobacter pigmenti]NJC20964.1 DNA-binding MarR family transcriptional regulator [Arthrobacter pigmenti]